MARSILVYGVTYHGSTRESLTGLDNVYGKHINAQVLRLHLKWLRERFYIAGLEELLRGVRQGHLPRRNTAFIVFHDGYRDNYDVAYPILQEFGVRATFFLTTNFIGTGERFWVDLLDAAIKYSPKNQLNLVSKTEELVLPLQNGIQRYHAAVRLRSELKRLSSDVFGDYFDGIIADLGYRSRDDVPLLGDHEHCMNWDMVREMSEGGMEFGSHTHRHIICARQNETTARQEMITSKSLIEKEVGKSCELFCYPNGYYPRDGNESTDRIASEVGYQHTLYMVGPYNLFHKDIFKITAIAYGEDSDIPELERTLSRYRYMLRKLKRSRIWPWEHDRLESMMNPSL